MQPKDKMAVDKKSKQALEAEIEAEKQARGQQCLDAIKENLKSFECEIMPTFQRIGNESSSGWLVVPK